MKTDKVGVGLSPTSKGDEISDVIRILTINE